jgi:hypothetical protein
MEDENQNIIEMKSLALPKPDAIAKKQAFKNKCPDILKMIGNDPNNPSNVKTVHSDNLSEEEAKEDFRSRVCEASGYKNHELDMIFLTKTNEACGMTIDSLKDSVTKLNILAKTMHALEPKDEIEGQLIAQLIILHEHSMSWLGRAMRTDQASFANVCLNGASKLLARHHETLAALLKYRRGDEQRMHVEHVHVYNGGKAIVGNVGAGDGGHLKLEEGPHAKV